MSSGIGSSIPGRCFLLERKRRWIRRQRQGAEQDGEGGLDGVISLTAGGEQAEQDLLQAGCGVRIRRTCAMTKFWNEREEKMVTRHAIARLGKVLGLLLAAGAMWITYGAAGFAQTHQKIQLPNGPAKPGFDIKRFLPSGGVFKPFYVKQTEPLRKVLQEGRVAEDTPVLVIATAGGNIALLTDQMVYHHIAQGRAGGKDWLAAF